MGASLAITAGSYVEVDLPVEIEVTSVSNLTYRSTSTGVEDGKTVVSFRSPRTMVFSQLFNPTSATKKEYTLD
jgi:hypothetical protein